MARVCPHQLWSAGAADGGVHALLVGRDFNNVEGHRRKEAYRRVGYEQRLRGEATLDDVDLDLTTRFLCGTVFRDRRPEDILIQYGLLAPRAGTPAVTNACLVLFCTPPAVRWHPRAGIRLFRVAGKERQHGTHRNVT